MADVFISYKRDDELRVARLVQALEKAGLEVWWDRALVGGESWRAAIDAALSSARSAVVVWTHASVGPEGGFVKDEAARAARRNILVPVLLDRGVELPLGFSELQAIDLTRWKGSARDPFLLDLVGALRAKIDGRPPPPPQGPVARLRRRLGWAGAASALAAAAAAFGSNTLNVQNHACAAPQAVSDVCGALGLGGRPARAERLAWEARTSGSCPALREHLRRFPDGALRATATALLDARRIDSRVTWTASERPLRLLVGRDVAPQAGEAAAREDALRRGAAKAAALCADFAATGRVRVAGARVEPQDWRCERSGAGQVCGFEGRALCTLEEATTTDTEHCDAAPAR